MIDPAIMSMIGGPGGMAKLVAAAQQPSQPAPPPAPEQPGSGAPNVAQSVQDVVKQGKDIQLPEKPATPGVGLDEAVRKLFPDVNWEAEAQKVVEEAGLHQPQSPGGFKITPWQWLAVLGPALGGMMGGRPGMALGGANAVLSGLYGGHMELMNQFRAQQAAYVKTVTDLGSKMADRAEKRATLLMPYFTMTADQASKAGIDYNKMILGLNEKQVDWAIKGLEIGVNQDKISEDVRHNKEDERIRALAETDQNAARLATERETARHNQETEQTAREQAAIHARDVASLASYRQQRIDHLRKTGGQGGELNQAKLETYYAISEAIKSGQPVSPQLQAQARMLNLPFDKISPAMQQQEREYQISLGRAKGDPNKVDPQVKANHAAYMQALGIEDAPVEPEKPGFWSNLFTGIKGGFNQPSQENPSP